MVSVRVPATATNFGPGFDSFGCAFTLYNTYTFEIISGGLEIFGCDESFRNRDNLCVVAYRYALEAMGLPMEPLCIHIDAQIPVGKGLGASSTMIVAGMMAANALHGSPLSREELLLLATVVEGHPDNLSAALYGGMTASLMQGGKPVTVRFPLSEKLRFFALLPPFALDTQTARSVLPQRVPFADAVHNAAHAAILLRALETADIALISAALEDRLHQSYRKNLIPGFDIAEQTALDCGAAAFFLSGGGPACLCIADSDAVGERLCGALPLACPDWTVLPLHVDSDGAALTEERT